MTLWRPAPRELLWPGPAHGLKVDVPVDAGSAPAAPSLLLRGLDASPGSWERSWLPGSAPVGMNLHTVRVVPARLPGELRARGVPAFLSELVGAVRPGARVWVRIHTHLHPGTVRVRWLRHTVDVAWEGARRTLLTCTAEIEDVPRGPSLHLSASRSDPAREWPRVVGRTPSSASSPSPPPP